MDQSVTANDDAHHPVKHAVVMVLGDIGRSPRMQYHTLSLLEEGHFVTLIGYAGERLIPQLEMALNHQSPANRNDDEILQQQQQQTKVSYQGHLHVLRMEPYQPPKTNIVYRLFYYPLRLTSLLYCVICTLWIQLNRVPHTTIPVDVVLVQNPPSVPTLWLAYLYCAWQGSRRGNSKSNRPRLVIDWHNLGYTMFAEPPDDGSRASPLGSSKAFVRKSVRKLAELYERKMAPLADAHLTVTQAMEVWLGENFNVHGERVRVLYDKPPFMFRPTPTEEQHELFRRLDFGESNDEPNTASLEKSDVSMQQRQEQKNQQIVMDETVFTRRIREIDGSTHVRLRDDRPALLVSSTSWTPDEDFSILLDALRELHKNIEATAGDDSFPKVVVVVTGKGPQKSYYLPLLKEFNKIHSTISIHTIWLEASDYPKLLGCATLGISLHTSTSGLDLPMKVLDMFGCQVPVCAIGFDCLGELVKDGLNGKIFQDGEELAYQLFDLLSGYPGGDGTMNGLESYRNNIRGMTRWKENWEECAQHLVVGQWADTK